MADEIPTEPYVKLRETYNGRPVLRQTEEDGTMFEYDMRFAVVYALSHNAAKRIQTHWREHRNDA